MYQQNVDLSLFALKYFVSFMLCSIKERMKRFNDVLNTFYMASDHSDRDREKPAAATIWTTLSDQQQEVFYMHHTIYRIVHTMAFIRPVVEHWLKGEITKCDPREGSIRRPIAQLANALPRYYKGSKTTGCM